MKNNEKVNESWQRCKLYGLEHSTQPQLERLGQSDQNSLAEEYHQLINTTDNEVLPYYENILSNTQCLILLTDNLGQTLNSWGDKRFLSSPQRAFFENGIDWKEIKNGTNAIGTALACGEPVQIQRDDHFLKANRFMIGSAAPIYDVNHTLLGVLNISSDTYLPQSHTLGMVKLMSQSIENRLIINTFSDEHFLLTFNTNFDNLDSQWSGIIVFNEAGTIISANRRAEILLCYDLALVNIIDIVDIPLQKIKAQLPNLPFYFTALNKYQMHGFLTAPIKNKIQAVDFRSNNPPASDTAADIIRLEQFSFGDEKVSRCIEQAERIINKDIPILIHGETGVGKEVFVKGLHHSSERRAQPLVAVNCAAIPNDLVESELFGYEKGAFTGASTKGAIGFIRKAHKGTLFLDEIGEMPLNVQSRLLRVLQERKVTPLGSTESYNVDIKLISATNRSLKKDVESGTFRQDLYYRVSGLNLELPPLRDRTDRKELFHQVNALYSNGYEKLSSEIIELFYQHPWPGNVRQLVSVLQIAQAMSDDEPIRAKHLPDDFFEDLEHSNNNKNKVVENETVQIKQSTEQLTLEDKIEADKAELIQVYNECKGNISQTAKVLAISRNTLYKRLKEIGIR